MPAVDEREHAQREMESELELAREIGSGRLWFGVLAGPVAWAVGLMVSYPLVPASCAVESALPLVVATFLTAAVTAAGGIVAWGCHRALARRDAAGDLWRGLSRASLMATGGIALSALFFLTVIGHAVAMLLVGPCQ